MNHEIKPLDVQLINQIAAGEVIEGPFSAVKELVENAIDALATEIRVDIRQGGKNLITVTDNGMGIPGDQIETAFMPHTTSKLRSIEDLQRIHTLGFRGEALASIAAVARIEVHTRAENSLTGYRAVFENGSLQSLEETGCPAGTKITVRDLFYQTPARLKFMKSDGAESSRITEMLTRLALSRPDIAFQYSNNNNIMLTTRKQNDPVQTAMTVFPADLAKELFSTREKTFQKGSHALKIQGLIGQPAATRGNRNFQIFFVNGRSVRNEVLTHAFEQAYEGSIMVKRFPVGILYVDLSPELLDVNVHPSKTSIKFQDPQWVDESLKAYVQHELKQQTMLVRPGGLGIGPSVKERELQKERRDQQKHGELPLEGEQKSKDQEGLNNQEDQNDREAAGKGKQMNKLLSDESQYSLEAIRFEGEQIIKDCQGALEDQKTDSEPVSHADTGDIKKRYAESSGEAYVREKGAREPLYPDDGLVQTEDHVSGDVAQADRSQQFFLDQVLKKRQYRLVGQAFETYILLEAGNYLYLIDQHAAHERVVYDRLLEDVQRGTVEIQEVMDGQILELTVAEMDWMQANLHVFRKMGFLIEPFGHQAIRLTGVPYHLGMPAHHQFLTNLMDELMGQEWSGGELPMEKLIRKACRYAIKAHDHLQSSEMVSLLDQMTTLRVPLSCPHGRPIVLQMRDYDLEKMFKRV